MFYDVAIIGAGIIDGFEDGTFRGEQGLTRAEFVKVMAIVLGAGESEGESKYSDCSGHWAEGWIAAFTKQGYLYGYEDGTFRPDQQMTRAEFVAIINRIIGKKKEQVPPRLSDLQPGHWAYADIMAAYMS